MQLYDTKLRQRLGSARDLRDDERDGVDGGIGLRALEAGLFKECTDEEVSELDRLKD